MPLKGQSLAEDSIQQMKESKAKVLQNKYDWDLIKNYLDTEINISSRNRKKKYITLREFKNRIVKGQSLKSIKQEGVGKHLINFYSSFCQGKIKLTKEEFEEDYNNGMELNAIAEKYNILRDHLIYLRQLYGIKTKGAKYIERKENDIQLTDRQKEILYGSMMGDAKKMSGSSVGFCHGTNQKFYLLWKFNEFKNIASEHSLQSHTHINPATGKENTTSRFYTLANTDCEECINMFYHENKEISKKVLEKLTPLSIAVWYMDDGGCHWSYKSVNNKERDITPSPYFCTDSFSEESIDNIIEWFNKSYNIKARKKTRRLKNRVGFRIIIEGESVYDFFELIKEHILDDFKYKIDYKSYLEYSNIEYNSSFVDLIEDKSYRIFNSLDRKDQDLMVDKFFKYYRSRGIYDLLPNPIVLSEDLNHIIDFDSNKIIKDKYIVLDPTGNNFVMSHFPNFLDAKSYGGFSPREIFDKDDILKNIIYEELQKEKLLSSKRLLHKIKTFGRNKKVSGFMPRVAKAIYDKYCDKESRVLDFCAGYGGRLAGAYASDKVKSYVGIDVNEITCNNLSNLYNNLKEMCSFKKEVMIFNKDSIDCMKMFNDKMFDICFTSPPYFNSEIYEIDNKGQSFNKYRNYSEWFNHYLIESLIESLRLCKKVIINMSNIKEHSISDDLQEWLDHSDYSYEIDYIRMPSYGGKYRFEELFVIQS